MNPAAPLFTADTLLPALQGLCAAIDAESAIPQPGSFIGAPETVESAEDLRTRLAEWIGSGDSVTGWLLTTEALHLFPGTTGLPVDIPLHAELLRAKDDASLNLRHTPQGWIWEELQLAPENDGDDAFLEESQMMIAPDPANPDRALVSGKNFALYQVEWRLADSPGAATPATFRPARSRFLGWK